VSGRTFILTFAQHRLSGFVRHGGSISGTSGSVLRDALLRAVVVAEMPVQLLLVTVTGLVAHGQTLESVGIEEVLYLGGRCASSALIGWNLCRVALRLDRVAELGLLGRWGWTDVSRNAQFAGFLTELREVGLSAASLSFAQSTRFGLGVYAQLSVLRRKLVVLRVNQLPDLGSIRRPCFLVIGRLSQEPVPITTKLEHERVVTSLVFDDLFLFSNVKDGLQVGHILRPGRPGQRILSGLTSGVGRHRNTVTAHLTYGRQVLIGRQAETWKVNSRRVLGVVVDSLGGQLGAEFAESGYQLIAADLDGQTE
jgi:hypothetical protein